MTLTVLMLVSFCLFRVGCLIACVCCFLSVHHVAPTKSYIQLHAGRVIGRDVHGGVKDDSIVIANRSASSIAQVLQLQSDTNTTMANRTKTWYWVLNRSSTGPRDTHNHIIFGGGIHGHFQQGHGVIGGLGSVCTPARDTRLPR